MKRLLPVLTIIAALSCLFFADRLVRSSSDFKKIGCSDDLPGKAAMQEDFARSLEKWGTEIFVGRAADGSMLETRLRLSKVKVFFSKPLVRLLDGNWKEVPDVTLNGGDYESESTLGAAGGITRDTEGRMALTINYQDLTSGPSSRYCKYIFDIDVKAAAKKVWTEKDKDGREVEKEEELPNFSLQGAKGVEHIVPLIDAATTPYRDASR